MQTRPEVEPEGVTIAAQDGIRIKYAGTQLNQYDADVFFEALHRARRHPLGTECLFQGASFLKSIGRSDSKLNYEDLNHSLRRLKRGTVDIDWTVRDQQYVFVGSLISTYTREKTSKLYNLTFAKEILTLFVLASWTQLEWDERKVFMERPLALWLHSYFSTHGQAVSGVCRISQGEDSSPTTRLAHFRTEIRVLSQ